MASDDIFQRIRHFLLTQVFFLPLSASLPHLSSFLFFDSRIREEAAVPLRFSSLILYSLFRSQVAEALNCYYAPHRSCSRFPQKLLQPVNSRKLKPSIDEVGMDKMDVTEKEAKKPYGANYYGGSTTRAGLFRTPISGGLHSATSSHDLPSPELAVRNLMEQARFAHLCTVMSQMHHRRAGYPCGSLVDYATDSAGHPIFSFSPLAIHTRNLLADPRCTLVVQIPGWSGLSNARVTIFGDAIPLPADKQNWAYKQFISKHQQWASQQWGNFYYYRMATIRDIYFIGGFGTVQWIDVKDYEEIQPDKIAADGGEQNLKELNEIFSEPLKEILWTEGEIDDVAFISIDSKGTDVRVRQGAQFNIHRLSFEVEHCVETLEEAKKALHRIVKQRKLKRKL